jgi:hypothetical protein
MDRCCTVWRVVWALASAWAALSAGVAVAAPDPDGNGVGVYLTFDDILERRRAELAGTRLAINPNLYIQHGWTSSPIEPVYLYSPELDTVFEVTGPAYFPEEPRSYLYDGAYYVYEPASLDIPGIELAARPSGFHQQRVLETTRQQLFQRSRARGIGAPQEGGDTAGFEIQVLPAMPEFMQGLVGRGATNIRVTGRESITFAGESRRVKPFIRTEQGSGQSLFPRLNMDQDLQVKLDGTVGDKVHVQVDHNSNAFGLDANRIQVWYEGYEDDIIRRIDLGGTNLTLPGSNLGSFGGGQGLFGVKSDLRLGSLDLTVVAAKQEAEAETRTLTPTGGSSTPVQIDENRYARDRFFFYERPDVEDLDLYDTYGVDVNLLFDENQTQNFKVFIDDQEAATETERNYLGYAVEGMPAAPTGADTSLFWNAYLDHPDQNRARWPSVDPATADSTFTPGRWRRLEEAEIGFVFFQVGDTRHVLGFFLRNRSLDSDDVLGVSYDTPDGQTVGTVDDNLGGTPQVRLRLVRHPNQDVSFDDHPTSIYMMRHVYVLPATQVSNLDVKIVTHAPGDQDPDIPNRAPQTTYLHMYGLDAVDAANNLTPDGVFDQSRVNLWDPEEGFLYLPGLRPFSPPDQIVAQRLLDAGIAGADVDSVFGQSERVPPTLYTLPRNDANIPSRKFAIEVRTTGTETEITLPQDIIEGSEEVRLDGRVLQAGVDYDIEPFAGGKITLKGEVLKEITPASRIEVKYDYRPLVGSGQATMYGATGQYKFGKRGRLSSTWLFESRRAFTDRPRLGEEPTRTLVGDLNGSLGFQPRWLTRLVDLLPFTNTSASSSVNLTAETAISVPNPNTRNNAYVDDLESAEDSDVFGMSRNNWYWASIPFDLADARADTTLRVPVAYYNPVGEVKRGHLNPELDEREADDGVTVLELGFNHAAAEAVAQNPPPGTDMTQMWSGLMTSFGGAGLDFTQTKTIEFWLNDGVGEPTQRFGRMHLDFGTLSEDFVFFKNNPTRPGGPLDPPEFNREAATRSEFRAQFDDLGWNGIDEDCEAFEGGDELPGPGSDCHVPSRQNPDGQHAWANGTEDNNEFDTEDINGNGQFNLTNSFFRYTLDLADLTWVVTDVQPEYGHRTDIKEETRAGFEGWRKYRIDFDVIRNQLESFARQGASAPSLRQIRGLRIWFEDPSAADPTATLFHHDIQIFDLKFTGSQWLQLGVFQTDGGQVAPAPGEAFSIGVINNKDDPSYVLPPGNTDINEEGVQSREQSLRLNFTNLMPEHEMVVQRTMNVTGAGLDFTEYRRLSYLVYYPRAASDSAEFFFRIGTDSLNFYEVAHAVPGPRDWSEVSVDLDSLTQLKFPG